MSISNTTCVHCDVCSTWIEIGQDVRRREARKEARSRGWKSTPKEDVCQKCVYKREAARGGTP
jgi:hypothetical protein